MALHAQIENPCQQPDADDPSTVCGATAAVGQHCLAHLAPDARAAWLSSLSPGSNIDVRRVAFSADLLEELLNALHDERMTPVFGYADFREASFSGDIRFGSASFSVANFDDASFRGSVWFIGTHFSYSSFNGVSFSRNASFEGAHFDKHAGFRGASFGKYAVFKDAIFKQMAGFGDASFNNDTGFEGASFGGTANFGKATFSGNASFRETTFNGDAGFAGTSFKGNSHFNGASFKKKSWFKDVSFNDEADFEGASFDETTWFGDASFNGEARFDNTSFNGNAEFGGASFNDEAKFEAAAFNRDAWFADTSFSKGIAFEDASFSGNAWFGSTFISGQISFEYAILRGELTMVAVAKQVYLLGLRGDGRVDLWLRAAEVDLTDVVLAGTVSIRGLHQPIPGVDESALADETANVPPVRVMSMRALDASLVTLTDVDLSRCLFTGLRRADQIILDGQCVFANGPGGRRRVLAEEHHWRASQTGSRSLHSDGWRPLPQEDRGRVDVVGPARLEVLYRQLRKALEDAKNEPGAADFYYGEMEMRRAATPRRAERWLLALYWAVSGYGLRARRALAWLALLIILSIGGLTWFGFPQTATEQTANGAVVTQAGQQPITLSIRQADPVKPLPDRVEKATELTLNAVIFRSPDADLTTAGRYLNIATRILGPVLLGLSVLAIRNQVKR